MIIGQIPRSNHRMDKLVLPQPLKEHIRASMHRSAHAILGPNEAHVYDVGEASKAVLVWNFNDRGGILHETGPLALHLGFVNSGIEVFKTGFALITLDKGSELSLCIGGLKPSEYLDVSRVRLDAPGSPLLTQVIAANFPVPTWVPNGVLGSGLVHMFNGEIDHGYVTCMVASEDCSHPEVHFERSKIGSDSRILSWSISYFHGPTPGDKVLASWVIAKHNLPAPTVFLIGGWEVESQEIGLKAWTISPDIDPGPIIRFTERTPEVLRAKFGKTPGNIHPPEAIAFSVARWLEVFHRSYYGKTVFEVPIEDEHGNPITSL